MATILKVVSKQAFEQLKNLNLASTEMQLKPTDSDSKNSETVDVASKADDLANSFNQSASKMNTDDIIYSLNKCQRSKAERLLQFLQKNTTLRWNDWGELVSNQTRCPFSNIVDLLSLATRPKNPSAEKLFIPGLLELVSQLMNANCPKNLLSNSFVKNYLDAPSQEMKIDVNVPSNSCLSHSHERDEVDMADESQPKSLLQQYWVSYEISKLVKRS